MADSKVILLAATLDLLLGDPRWLPHPVRWIGSLIAHLERLLRRRVRYERTAGVILLVITVGVTYVAAFAVIKAAFALHFAAGFFASAIISYFCLAARSLHKESQIVADALIRGDINEARRLLAFIVGRDTENLSESEIWRALVETVSENTSDGVIAPLFYLIVGGPAMGLAYKAVNTLDSMVGYKNERYLNFGWASARFDDVVNYIPARITGLLMATVAAFVGLSAVNAWRIMWRDGGKHSSPNSGVPEAAAAGALGVQVGGTNYYFGKPVEKPTIGDAHRANDLGAYRGAVRLMYGAEILLLAFTTVIVLAVKYLV